jgi:hypothetical protein
MKKLKTVEILRSLVKFFLMLSVVLTVSCGGDDEDPALPSEPESQKITITPSTSYQEMVGFGGALTGIAIALSIAVKRTKFLILYLRIWEPILSG